jgi:hypothetical protein
MDRYELEGDEHEGRTIERENFLRMMMKPEAPDEMNFVLRSQDPDPQRFFSIEGVEEITQQIRDFVLARAMASYVANGRRFAPKNVSLNVKLDWRGPSNQQLENRGVPWYGGDDRGPTPLDGDRRVRAAREALDKQD